MKNNSDILSRKKAAAFLLFESWERLSGVKH
jgi:hypothetical protein